MIKSGSFEKPPRLSAPGTPLIMDNFVQEFLVEARDYLEQIDQDLLTLERDGASREILGRIFRNFHSIKGCAQFLGFPHLGAVGHSGESLLSLFTRWALGGLARDRDGDAGHYRCNS